MLREAFGHFDGPANAAIFVVPIRSGVLRRVKGHVKAVDGVSLAVRQGTTLGVVGESGIR